MLGRLRHGTEWNNNPIGMAVTTRVYDVNGHKGRVCLYCVQDFIHRR
jgi:hypothetical protein